MDRVTEPTLVLRRRICRGTLLPALAALLIPVLAEAGSTGTTQLHMPQGTTAGLIQVTGGQLRIQDNNNGNPSSIQREANLTGFTTATFSFDFSFQGTVAADTMQVQVSANGGTSWTTLDTLAGNLAAGSKS